MVVDPTYVVARPSVVASARRKAPMAGDQAWVWTESTRAEKAIFPRPISRRDQIAVVQLGILIINIFKFAYQMYEHTFDRQYI